MNQNSNVLSIFMSELMPKIKRLDLKTYHAGDIYSDHVHKNEIEIMYVFQGFFYMGINNHYIKIKKNNCLVISADTVHNLILKKNERCRAACLIFNPGMVSKYFNRIDLQNKLPFLYELFSHKRDFFSIFIDHDNRIKSIVERIYHQKNNNSEYTGELLALYFCELYLHLSILFNENIRRFKSANNSYSIKALEFINNHYTNDISVTGVAGYVGISERHLSRIFAAQFCMTIREYIVFLRMEKAKILLAETDSSITTIAQCIGYNSSQYFATAFKMFEKVSPKEYRRMAKG